MDRAFDILAGITTIALVTTLVAHRNTSNVISAVGNTYVRGLRAAMGN